jgi:putative ABC transport system substrate-binding protein
VQLEIRHGGGDPDAIRKHAAELAALTPDVIVTIGGSATGRLIQTTKTVPIVFTIVPDPVGSGFVKSLSRPGGNATGFIQFEYSLSGKWLELLKEISPQVTRAAVIRDSGVQAGVGQFAVIQAIASALEIEVSSVDARQASDIEHDINDFARHGHGGLIVSSSTSALVHRDLIVSLAARQRLPCVYSQREYVVAGGLISYAADFSAQFRNAAAYVDRILKGEKPADLPVAVPNKYNLTINLKTAKELGLDMPETVLSRADEVIE